MTWVIPFHSSIGSIVGARQVVIDVEVFLGGGGISRATGIEGDLIA